MQTRFLSFISLAVLIFAGGVAYLELRPFVAGGGERTARYSALANGETTSGISLFSQKLVIDGCLEALTSIYGRLQPTARRAAVQSHCAAEAQAITARAPSYSYAWYFRALAASLDEDFEAMNAHLLQSRAMGLNEQWVAELRVALAEDHYDRLDDANLRGNEADLFMLVNSRRGVRSIARRYLQRPDFRERITALVETLPQDRQAEFVANVRRSARELGLL